MKKNALKSSLPLLLALTCLAGCGITPAQSSSAKSESSAAASSEAASSQRTSSSTAEVEEVAPAPRTTYANGFTDNIPDQWESYGVGDPFVYRYNGWYYLYCSTKDSETGIRAWKSKDLVHWSKCTGVGLQAGYVSEDPVTLAAYAPEVIAIDGSFYMITSPAGNGHYVLKASSPEGPFTAITANFGQSIDGSFYRDENEQLYLLRANTGVIKMMKMNSDFTASGASSLNLLNSAIGNWTEGPYLLSRFGYNYLTYTGTNVVSAGYRVGYSYGKGKAFSKNGYSQDMKNLVLSTDADFNGLGHSATVMGPNLDSYYLTYHNLVNSGGPWRRYCLSRLYFNGTDMMVNHPELNGNMIPEGPTFASYNPKTDLQANGDFLLSPNATGNAFTAEYNVTGKAGKMVFGFVDSSNYSYLIYNETSLSAHQVSSGTDTTLQSVDFISSHASDVNHTFRLAYKDGKADVTFDDMRKIGEMAITIPAGKIGYSTSSDVLGFTGYSNHAYGDSDQSDFKQDEILANSYDPEKSTLTNGSTLSAVSASTSVYGKNGSFDLTLKNGDTARYLVYQDEAAYQALSFRVPLSMLGKKLAVGVDGKNYQTFTIPTPSYASDYAGYVSVEVGRIPLKKGSHYLDVRAVDEVSFNSIHFDTVTDSKLTFTNDLSTLGGEGLDYQNVWKAKNGGHFASSGNRQLLYIGKKTITDVELSVDITLSGATGTGTAGILLRADNAAFSISDNNDSIQGYYLAINNSKVMIQRKDYGWTSPIASNATTLASETKHTLKATIKGSAISLYVDGAMALSAVDPNVFANGHIGLYTDGAAATYQNLTAKLG